MRELNLNSMGVQEMSVQEMKETDGGFWLLLIGAAVAIGGCFAFEYGEQIGDKIYHWVHD